MLAPNEADFVVFVAAPILLLILVVTLALQAWRARGIPRKLKYSTLIVLMLIGLLILAFLGTIFTPFQHDLPPQAQ